MDALMRFRIPDLPPVTGARVLLLVYLLCMAATHGGVVTLVAVWMAILSMAGLVWPSLVRNPVYWLVLSLVLAANLVPNYSRAANHYYLTVYTALFVTLDAYRESRGERLSFNVSRALLIVVFGFAALQKLLSEYFMSGRLLANYILSGDALYHLLSRVYPGYADVLQAFVDTTADIAGSPVLSGSALPLTLPGAGFPDLCRALAILIAVFELLVLVALSVPKVFYHRAMPALVVAFVWGTFTFRNEFSFFGLLCLLFLMARPDMSPAWQRILLLTFGVFLAYDVAGVSVLF